MRKRIGWVGCWAFSVLLAASCVTPQSASVPGAGAPSSHRNKWGCIDKSGKYLAPPAFDRFRLVIEIVGQSEAEKVPARARWSAYRQRGLETKAFDAERRVAL